MRPEAVLSDRALCLPTFGHYLIINKTSLSVSLSRSRSLSLSLALAVALALSLAHARARSLAELSSPEMLAFANRFSKMTQVCPLAALCGNRMEVAFEFVEEHVVQDCCGEVLLWPHGVREHLHYLPLD